MKNSEYETSFEEISVPFNEKYSRYENENRKCRSTAILPEFISYHHVNPLLCSYLFLTFMQMTMLSL